MNLTKLLSIKWVTWWLPAGLMLMISCDAPALKGDKKTAITTLHSMIQVEKTVALPAFPSGSSLEFYNNHLYLAGDDAKKLLILDVDYKVVDSVTLFTNDAARIPKIDKADLESSTVVSVNHKDYLLLVGSASLSPREKIFLLPLDSSASKRITDISISTFLKRLTQLGLKQVNIEGAATIERSLLLANRGNLAAPQNHLVITGSNFWLDQASIETRLLEIEFPAMEQFAGISGLAYVASEDLLFFTASTELTENNFDDGAIGKSYIGWIKNFGAKWSNSKVTTDGFVDLAAVDKVFAGEKIESICISDSSAKQHTVHLVSDNDDGASKLFMISLQIK